MLKAEIKKEVIMTNKEIAHFLYNDGALLDEVDGILENMLYRKYKMDYDTRMDAVAQLTMEDYAEILKIFADDLLME